MLIKILFCFILIVTYVRQIRSLEVMLLNGSLTIINFDKACESSGFLKGDPKILEGEKFIASIENSSLEPDSLFGVILETFCPYVGYYQIEENPNVNATEDNKTGMPMKINNLTDNVTLETMSTLDDITTDGKRSTVHKSESDILNLVDSSTKVITMLVEHEIKTTRENNHTIPVVTESITSPMETKIITNKSGRQANVTKTMVFSDEESTVKNITESLTLESKSSNSSNNFSKEIDMDFENKIERPTTSDFTKKEDTIFRHVRSTTKRSSIYEFKNETIFRYKPVELSTKKISTEFEYVSTKMDTTEITDVMIKPTIKIQSPTTNSLDIKNNTILFSGRKVTPLFAKSTSVVDDIKGIGDAQNKERIKSFIKSSKTTATDSYFGQNKSIMDTDMTLPFVSLTPTFSTTKAALGNVKTIEDITEKVKTIFRPENSTDSFDAEDKDLLIYTSEDDVNINDELVANANESTKNGTEKSDDEDYYDESEEDTSDMPLKLYSYNTNVTLVYKHDTKSVDERRKVVVILFVSILLALTVIWASKIIYRRQKGVYVLPQNQNNEGIELGEDPLEPRPTG